MLNKKQILKDIASIRGINKKIVFTNGCFDLLHKGHKDLIKTSNSYGDKLVVGLNSDESVKRLKGKDRPIQNEFDRKNALLDTGYVEKVYIFNHDTPLDLILLIKPDILVKGGDYKEEEIAGAKFIKKFGGEVAILPYEKGHSTSKIIKKIGD